jgi:hypothetical protein
LIDFDEIEFQIWEENLARELQLIQDQVGSQDTSPQKRRYSIESLDSMDSEPIERRYPLRKRQLTTKAAAIFIE